MSDASLAIVPFSGMKKSGVKSWVSDECEVVDGGGLSDLKNPEMAF
jgi:hypothetical protein